VLKSLCTGDEQYERLKALSPRSLSLLPICIRGLPVGRLVFARTDTVATDHGNWRVLSEELASRVAQAIDNATLYQAAQREIAERKRVAEELQQAREKLSHHAEDLEKQVALRTASLQEALAQLEEFSYSVSHDLRAPIASVLGLINLAKKDENVEMKNIYLDKINNSALQQDNFIREILDQSRNSRLDVKKEEVLFEPLIDETFNQLKFATSTGQSVERVIQINQTEPFISDRWRIKVILNNIISNAIRYRNGKDPVIKVNVDINDHRVKLEVEDNGKGIGKEHMDNLYRMFYRPTHDGAGTGMGLYLCT
jgi:signal transduction histidine kinase